MKTDYQTRHRSEIIGATRMTAVDRACLRFTEIDYQMRRHFSALASSSTLAVGWLRRKPVTFTVTFNVRGGKINV